MNKKYLIIFLLIVVIVIIVAGIFLFFSKLEFKSNLKPELKIETKSESSLEPKITISSDIIQWEIIPIELDWLTLGAPKEWNKKIIYEGNEVECSASLAEKNAPAGGTIIPYGVGKVSSGKYKGGELIDVLWNSKGPGYTDTLLNRFIKLNDKYFYLSKYSSQDTELCIEELFKDIWHYTVDNDMEIKELYFPEVLRGAENGQIVYYMPEANGNDLIFEKDYKKLAFIDQTSSLKVYFYSSENGEDFHIRLPDGLQKIFSLKIESFIPNNKIVLNSGEIISGDYTAYYYRCLGYHYLNFIEISKDELYKIGKNASSSPVYLDKNNQLTKNLYKNITESNRADMTYEEFGKGLPLFLWADPFGRFIKFIRRDYYDKYLAPDGC